MSAISIFALVMPGSPIARGDVGKWATKVQ
jgi:hypothetical protein